MAASSASLADPIVGQAIYPFSALVGADDLTLALLLTAVSPQIGGVLVRGEKGTAKSTAVRALAAVLPDQAVVVGCRFGCAPAAPDARCPDGPHGPHQPEELRAARLVELPVGATEDRVIGSLDLTAALSRGVATYEPGLLASANRGILYVDEVNLLHDHLVDLLLDAAAMGRNTVERDGISVTHAARIVLVGTMNPEEGELRPQLLDRFGLAVEVTAPKDVQTRTEIVRRRLAFDADPPYFAGRFAAEQQLLRSRILAARAAVADVDLPDGMLAVIARVCAGFGVEGLRADLVTARTAVAHAAWSGRRVVTKADVRAAARLSLPHRRRRSPFDTPGLDEALLDELLDGPDDEPDPTDATDPERPDSDPRDSDPRDSDRPHPDDPMPGHDQGARRDGAEPARPSGAGAHEAAPDAPSRPRPPAAATEPQSTEADEEEPAERHTASATGTAAAGRPYRARLLKAKGVGAGQAGRRSQALTTRGRTVRSTGDRVGAVHLPATIRAAARRRGPSGGRLDIVVGDVRRAVARGREANLVLLCVDASGSMAARRRMEVVKTAVLSLLLDAYQRRDQIGLVTFRGQAAELALPPTGSVDVAARRLADLAHGGRTPLAEGLLTALVTIRRARLRDPARRPLLVVVTDGRATSGPDPLLRAMEAARLVRADGVSSVVIDCEASRLRLGLAERLAGELEAEHVPMHDLAAGMLVDAVRSHTAARREDVA
ncbi:magnesium chelatase [Intrasporangium chromatireducens Q5-1]|uniref:Mg-protoporphyrin IX chelatase n=1 Tax=Intrasporangium chromatireducens Q5-1 TaxID=584657 RepID=W9GLU4_9MICO|nr:VWA domain-containing protein [Intrasporangium chromatireducens]EWT07045.1 magnesium chelatase [Intrasporangium chromatireducens Q5-1]